MPTGGPLQLICVIREIRGSILCGRVTGADVSMPVGNAVPGVPRLQTDPERHRGRSLQFEESMTQAFPQVFESAFQQGGDGVF